MFRHSFQDSHNIVYDMFEACVPGCIILTLVCAELLRIFPCDEEDLMVHMFDQEDLFL